MTERATLPNGYYTVPAGKLANAVIWLEMRARPKVGSALPLRLLAVTSADRPAFQLLFAEVGTPWLWSRFPDADPGGQAFEDIHFVLDDAGDRVGVVALGALSDRSVEIGYFGLRPEATGRGLGRRMMAAVLDRAWALGPERVWLHTCNFDHPGALRFYQACGFTPYATGFEIMDDLRLSGTLPRDAAPHVPLIDI